MDDRKLLALARKNAASSQPANPRLKRFGKTYDATLPPTIPVDQEAIENDDAARKFFHEMRTREF